MTIDFAAGDDIDPLDPIAAERRTFTWTLLDVSSEGVEIDLKFDDPLYISQGEVPDTLVAKFNKNELYMEPKDPEKSLLPNGFSVPITIPPQMPTLAEVVAEILALLEVACLVTIVDLECPNLS